MYKSLNKIIYFFIFPLSLFFMGFGNPLPGLGKLALSNIYQVIVLCILILFAKIKKKDLILAFIIFLLSLASIFYVLNVYAFNGKILVLFFLMVSILYLMYSRTFIKNNYYNLFRKKDDFYHSISKPLIFCFFLFLFFLLYQINTHASRITFGMEDKSHASIILSFLSFLSLKAFKKYWLPFSLAFFMLTLFSLSRLSFIFLPFIAIYMAYRIVISKSLNLKIMSIIIFIIFIISAIYFINKYPTFFSVINRISSIKKVDGSDSTNAHMLLILKGLQLKFASIGNFIFGVSPGSFGDILVRSEINFHDLNSVDPNFIHQARFGRAPIHSTHLAFFVEYPIVIFLAYITYNISIIYRLYLHKLYYELLFYVPFNIAIMFYSAHNKFYYFVVLLFFEASIIISKIMNKREKHYG